MHYIGPVVVIVGALLCLSSFIIARKPEAGDLFAKVAPFQGFLGVGMLGWGLFGIWYYAIREATQNKTVLAILMGDGTHKDMLAGISLVGYIASEIVIGFCLGFGLIASWIPGESDAEKKGLEIQRKLLGFSLPIGLAGLVFSVLWLIKMPSF